MKKTLPEVVALAKEVRERLLVVAGPNDDLAGYCAQASIHLAALLGDVTSLRANVDELGTGHYWNVAHGHIVDITASQFEDKCYDVLVTRKPRQYHRPVSMRGLKAFQHVLEEPSWLPYEYLYETQDAIRKLCARRKLNVPALFQLRNAT